VTTLADSGAVALEVILVVVCWIFYRGEEAGRRS
jgi:hypothetical protein